MKEEHEEEFFFNSSRFLVLWCLFVVVLLVAHNLEDIFFLNHSSSMHQSQSVSLSFSLLSLSTITNFTS